MRLKGAINNYARPAGENWDCLRHTGCRVSKGLEVRNGGCEEEGFSFFTHAQPSSCGQGSSREDLKCHQALEHPLRPSLAQPPSEHRRAAWASEKIQPLPTSTQNHLRAPKKTRQFCLPGRTFLRLSSIQNPTVHLSISLKILWDRDRDGLRDPQTSPFSPPLSLSPCSHLTNIYYLAI